MLNPAFERARDSFFKRFEEALKKFQDSNTGCTTCAHCGKLKEVEIASVQERQGDCELQITGWREAAVGWITVIEDSTRQRICLCTDCQKDTLVETALKKIRGHENLQSAGQA